MIIEQQVTAIDISQLSAALHIVQLISENGISRRNLIKL